MLRCDSYRKQVLREAPVVETCDMPSRSPQICCVVPTKRLGVLGGVGIRFIGHWYAHVSADFTVKMPPIADAV